MWLTVCTVTRIFGRSAGHDVGNLADADEETLKTLLSKERFELEKVSGSWDGSEPFIDTKDSMEIAPFQRS